MNQRPANIETERLLLVTLLPEEIEALIAGKAEHVAFLTGFTFPPDDPNRGVDLSWHFRALQADRNQLSWRIRVIVERSSNTVIGSINLKGPPNADGDVEIGWGLNEDARGKGYATEASAAVINWAISQPGVSTISATIPDDNYPSLRLAGRLGFARTGGSRRNLPIWEVRPELKCEHCVPIRTSVSANRTSPSHLSQHRVMEGTSMPSLSDGVIQLRPLTQADAADHLAGEDKAIAKWLSGGRSTAATVQTAIEKFEEQWRIGGPRRAFGVFNHGNGQLIGFVEANLGLLGNPAEVNVSYGTFPPWRGRGLAGRAIDLVAEYLRIATEARWIVLQIAPENTRSIRVAEKAGFARVGVRELPEGQRVRYMRKL
ncbi:MAG TPA: GNAT family N-acetyltransferase [Candidatus Sulfotelmatobacter sp.]|nr:GNAT family N-acetyltransferase [Candidatus Sulfotelmatobacter sp.]HUE51646.1 GNAT family N-acetyltransferase [Terriglobales bacterium]